MKFPIYLDYSSTTPISPEVLETMLPYLKENFGNPSSRMNYHGMLANAAINNARKKIAQLINADEDEIIFTSGATEANNLAIKGIASNLSKKQIHIITSKIEHSSVLEVCKYLSTKNYEISFIDADKSGLINIHHIEKNITDKTALISIMHVNNETGVIMPIIDIASLATKYNIIFHSDCTQSIDKIPIDVKKTKIDLLSFSAHKIYGPKGCGVLYVNKKYLNSINPILHGGHQELNLRSGTLNVASIIGLSKSVESFFNTSTYNKIKYLQEKFERTLQNELDIKINGLEADRISNISNITFRSIDAKKLILKQQSKISCSMGSACLNESDMQMSHVLKNMGLSDDDINSTIRFSFGKYTTEEEIDYVLKIIITAIKN